MQKNNFIINGTEFQLIFRLLGKDIITIDLVRVSGNNSVNMITLLKTISNLIIDFLNSNQYSKVAFIFNNQKPEWIDICQWAIDKKLEGLWKMTRHPHIIFVEKI